LSIYDLWSSIMGEVIGPVEARPQQRLIDWFTMRETKNHFKWAQAKDPVKYRLAIDSQRESYKRLITNYAQGKLSH